MPKKTPVKSKKPKSTKSKSILQKEVQEIEQWIHERKRFFKKLIWIIIIISIILLLARFI